MAMKKPVIASRTSDCHKIIDSGVDGLLFDPGDKEGFLKHIKSMNDPDYRRKIEENVLGKVSNFTWDRQVSIIVDNLKSICQKKIGNKIH
jgi:glycosyltransferase involved in cell wall biosynthesis